MISPLLLVLFSSPRTTDLFASPVSSTEVAVGSPSIFETSALPSLTPQITSPHLTLVTSV